MCLNNKGREARNHAFVSAEAEWPTPEQCDKRRARCAWVRMLFHLLRRDVVRVREGPASRLNVNEDVVAGRNGRNVQAVCVKVGAIEITELVVDARRIEGLGRQHEPSNAL